MCSFTGTTAVCGKCERCGHGTPSGAHVLCNTCAEAANQCQRCAMDMAQSESPLVWRQTHLRIKAGACGACQEWDGPDSHKFHQALPEAAEVTLTLDLVIHNFVMISFAGTGTTASDWKVELDRNFCRERAGKQSICIFADRLGTSEIVLQYKLPGSADADGLSEDAEAEPESESEGRERCQLKKLTLKLNVSNPPAQIK
jgi:hypothetical protein